jgi:hypothetical protein
MREEVRLFSARALTTGAAVTTLVDEIALARANTARWRHGHTRSGEVRMLFSKEPDDRRRMGSRQLLVNAHPVPDAPETADRRLRRKAGLAERAVRAGSDPGTSNLRTSRGRPKARRLRARSELHLRHVAAKSPCAGPRHNCRAASTSAREMCLQRYPRSCLSTARK